MSEPSITVVAVDTGGTFTDFVILRGDDISVHKRPSTPEDPARAVLDGLKELLDPGEEFDLAHGSTVATNALLERRGARTFWITNRGFEDLIEIGRQNRPQLYALVGWRPPPLAASDDRIGISGRMLKDGSEETPLDEDELAGLSSRLHDAESIAIGLLHSYANPEHEERIARTLAGLGVPITCSARLLPEYREYERYSTALVNAYVAPLVRRYLNSLREAAGAGTGAGTGAGAGAGAGAPARHIRIMASAGGAFPLERAAREPVHTILSGPAGGVVAALAAGARTGDDHVLSFDMGGTSTDVSLCPGTPLHTKEYEIAGAAVAIPVIDIHTVGAGGGSIARIDAGGALQVGPRSAGAVPGPICYGRGGGQLTVTDAHVWLGRIPERHFLGGELELERGAVEAPLTALAEQLGVSLDGAAEGVIAVADTHMEGALRLISVERGYDPANLALVAFGGAAPLHASGLAARLGIARVIIPPDPGTLSAQGILVADVRKDVSRSVLLIGREMAAEALDEPFGELEAEALGELEAEGQSRESVELSRSIDARYRGQSYELPVPAAADWVERFHRAHQRRFGFAREDSVIEAVTLRVTGIARVARPKARKLKKGTGVPSPQAEIAVFVEGSRRGVPLHEREALGAGHLIAGPAVVAEYSATTWLPPGWWLEVRASGDLVLSARN